MEGTKKSGNDHGGNKRMVIKSGGGIGAVLLLGGALATAALASAFAVRQKRRSSGGNHSRNSSPDISEKMEEDTREEVKEEVGMENVVICDESLKMEEKGKFESDDDGFVMVKEEISLYEKENFELIKEDVSSNIQDDCVGGVEVSLEMKEFEDPFIQQDNLLGYEEEEAIVEMVLEDEAIEEEEEEEATVQMVLEDEAIEEEEEGGGGEEEHQQKQEEEATVQMVLEDEAIERIEELDKGRDELHGEMQSALNEVLTKLMDHVGALENQQKKEEKETNVQMVLEEAIEEEGGGEEKEEHHHKQEEEATMQMVLEDEAIERIEELDKGRNELRREIQGVLSEVLTKLMDRVGTLEDQQKQEEEEATMQMVLEDEALEAIEEEEEEQQQQQQRDPSYVIKEEWIDAEKKEDWIDAEKQQQHDPSVDLSNWKPLQQSKLIKNETGGKILEDPKVYIPLVAYGKGVKYQTNSSRRRMIILTLSVLSSLSCSCLFNLSSAKLCLVAFLTVFLLEIYGYSLLNHAAKGDGSYEQIS